MNALEWGIVLGWPARGAWEFYCQVEAFSAAMPRGFRPFSPMAADRER
jgi:hypothetical protein